MNYRCIVQYDGTRYEGWQKQKRTEETIQGKLEKTLRKITGEEVQVIGATTFNEYRKYIEKDSALERRFQPVTANEPSIEDTIELLKGIKEYYEEYHKLYVSDDLSLIHISEPTRPY